MRVAFVVPGFSPGDGTDCIPGLEALIRSLSKRLRPMVYAVSWPEKRGSWAVGPVPVQGFGPRHKRLDAPRRWLGVLETLAADHRAEPFDAIHGFWADEPGWLATLAARRLGIPSIVSTCGVEIADLPDYHPSRWRRLLVRHCVATADVVTTASRWAADRTPRPMVSRPAPTVLPWGVDVGKFRPAGPRTSPVALVVSSLAPPKDVAVAIRAVAAARKRVPELTMRIAGRGPEQGALERLAADLGLPATFGAVKHAEMPALYASAGLLVHASRHETQCMSIVEALATGLPVASTAVGGASDLAGTGLVHAVRPGDVAGLADAVVAAWNDRDRAAEAGPLLVARDFELEKQAEAFLGLYESVRTTRP